MNYILSIRDQEQVTQSSAVYEAEDAIQLIAGAIIDRLRVDDLSAELMAKGMLYELDHHEVHGKAIPSRNLDIVLVIESEHPHVPELSIVH